ncbi:MAG: peptidylprolyl isomerase [Acidobacteriota bacterium]|jgi:peptidyl-prolyl cis-trans isomerase B (cyclophilin B)|nr:MAG: peptidylprolyl isomerase [Acidobacteriota bacterium]
MRRFALLIACLLVLAPALLAQEKPANPRMIIETAKGSIEIEFFRDEAPKSVEHILGLARRNFYRAQRIHRVERTLVQFGDRNSRDMTRRDWWGRGGSGTPIGVAEFNKRSHVRGAVSLAHGGNPAGADSQMFIVKVASPGLDGKHVVIGRVVQGMDVVDRLEVADQLKQVTVVE